MRQLRCGQHRRQPACRRADQYEAGLLDRRQAERTRLELVCELFDGVTVAPVIQDVRQIRNDCRDARLGKRPSQIAVPLARTRETVGYDGHAFRGLAVRLVNIDVDAVSVELNDVGVENERWRLGERGGAHQICDRQRTAEQCGGRSQGR
jgi:hypothetical protein